MLAVTLYDIYMASMILGAGYVVVSAVLGNFHFSAAGDVGAGDVGGGTGGDIGHGGLDAGAGDLDAGGGDIGHDMAHDTGHVVDATDERRRAFSAFQRSAGCPRIVACIAESAVSSSGAMSPPSLSLERNSISSGCSGSTMERRSLHSSTSLAAHSGICRRSGALSARSSGRSCRSNSTGSAVTSSSDTLRQSRRLIPP